MERARHQLVAAAERFAAEAAPAHIGQRKAVVQFGEGLVVRTAVAPVIVDRDETLHQNSGGHQVFPDGWAATWSNSDGVRFT